MQYVALIYQGTTPLPGTPAWDALPEDEQKAVYADCAALNQTAGVTPGLPLGPVENATTVRAQDGKPLVTDGPFVGTKEAAVSLGHDRVVLAPLSGEIAARGGPRPGADRAVGHCR